MSTPANPSTMNRRQQMVEAYRRSKETDKRLGLWILGAFVIGAAVGFTLMFLIPPGGVIGLVMAIVFGLLLGLLLAAMTFARRAQKAMLTQMDGRPGAAAQTLSLLKRGWKTDPVIAFNKQQDVVHRVVGPPGIVLVGEGSSPARVKSLLTAERRKHERVASDTPVHEIVVGNDEGQVPLGKLVRHVTKLGRQVKPAEMTDVLARLKALDANRPNIPLPKGPIPTSMKGMRGNMRGR